MSQYVRNYTEYLGQRKCCDLRGPGPKGDQGDTGPAGPRGAYGYTGPTGAQGPTGLGCRGPTGPAGSSSGLTGPTGPQGMQGLQGDTGPQGIQGLQGDTGPQGIQGLQGDTGPQGIQGDTGPSQWSNTSYINSITSDSYTGIGITGIDVLIGGNLYVSGKIDPTSLTLSQTGLPYSTYGLTGSGAFINTSSGDLFLTPASGNVNVNNVTNVLNIIGSAIPSNDLNIQSNNNILMIADNIDLGTTEIIYPTLATPARLRLNASGQILIDNNGGGTSTASSAVVLNQVSLGGGILTEEVYNQRTGVNGSFSQKSFYAKNSADGKLECARITAVAENIASNRGQLDLGVAGSGGVVSSYISLSGNNDRINALRNISMNNNDITSCDTITSSLNNQYSKEIVQYLNSNSTAPTATLESNLRYIAINLGKASTWEEATSITTSGLLGLENITASCLSFAGAWWVGTEAGNVYSTVDSGSTWALVYSFGAKINCLVPYNSGSYLAVGGQFSLGTGSYNYIAGIDTSNNVFDITSGNSGLNGEVKTIYENTANYCLYIGGSFDDWYSGSSSQFPKFLTYDYFGLSFYPLNNNGGAGFSGGDVLTITRDNNSGFIIVGGSFINSNIGSGGLGIGYLFTFQTTLGYDVNSYFSIGNPLNGAVNSVEVYSFGVIVGGDFTNPLIHPSWTDSFGIYIVWNGTNWDLNNFPFFTPSFSINYITYLSPVGTYYTITNNNILYQASTQLLPIPIGSSWKCISFNGSITVFATNAQTSAGFLFYTYDQNVGITINGGGNTFNSINGSNFTNCLLTNINSSVEMIWNSTLSKWFVISQEGCNFS